MKCDSKVEVIGWIFLVVVCLSALLLFSLIPADSLNLNLVYKGF